MPTNMLCLPVMPVQCIPCGGRRCLRAIRISTAPLSGNWPFRASSRLLIYGLNFCSPHLSVKKLMTLDSPKRKGRTSTRYFVYYVLPCAIARCPFTVRQNIWILCTSVRPPAPEHMPVKADKSPEGGLLLPAKNPAQPPADISYRYFTGSH